MATSEPLTRRTLDVGLAGVVFALFTTGYIIGVWTAFLVLRQPQRAYEDGTPASPATAGAIAVRAVAAERRLLAALSPPNPSSRSSTRPSRPPSRRRPNSAA